MKHTHPILTEGNHFLYSPSIRSKISSFDMSVVFRKEEHLIILYDLSRLQRVIMGWVLLIFEETVFNSMQATAK